MKKLVLETTAPFQGLPELVAYDEGLFEKEGLIVEWADREKDVEKSTDINVVSPQGLDPFSSHGKLLEQGQADMYNACEWGNYCRVQDTRTGSRQVGRRGIVTYAALAVRADSPVYTAQQLAGRTVGVPFYFGTHYLALHMLEGFLPRDQIKVCRAPNGSRYRFDAMMKGEIEATTLTEPYATLAEKKGCRLICEAFYHGTEVASDKVDAATYGAFNRAVREASTPHQRQQGGVPALLHRLSQSEGSGDRVAAAAGHSREPPRCLRPHSDPARRNAADLRLAEGLGHAAGNRFAPASRQHGRAGAGTCAGGLSTIVGARAGWHVLRWRCWGPCRRPRPRPIFTPARPFRC
jgi:NitT/TauT family transport system substrate-binding protein